MVRMPAQALAAPATVDKSRRSMPAPPIPISAMAGRHWAKGVGCIMQRRVWPGKTERRWGKTLSPLVSPETGLLRFAPAVQAFS